MYERLPPIRVWVTGDQTFYLRAKCFHEQVPEEPREPTINYLQLAEGARITCSLEFGLQFELEL